MKRISLLVLMLFISTLIQAQKKQIILSQEGNQLVNLRKSNLGFTSKATTNKLTLTNVHTQKGDFVNLDADGLFKIYTKGVPNLPVYSKLIEVPQDAKVSIKILSFDEEIIDLNAKGITEKITPAQPSGRKSGRNDKFYMDKKLYHKDAFFSLGKKVIYEESGQMRAIRLGRIEIRPFAYNPVKNILKVYKNIKFQVNFEGADLNKTQNMKRKYGGINSTPANLFFKLNQDNKSFFSQMPFTYVIVADRAYQSALQPFVQWKTKKGFKVIEAYTDDPNVGNTVASIKAYCQNLYQNPPAGVNPLSFILVVGDIDIIPATQHSEVDSSPYTDLDIAEYTGDYLPEVNFGRWSVDNAQQVTDIVDKTIKYEKLQMSDINYLEQTLLLAGDDEGHEDTYGGGAIYYADHYYANATNHIHSHTFLQNTIETWGGNSQGNQQAHDSIIANINTGVGLANYTAHCSPDGWAAPSFTRSDLNGQIHNDEKYGLWIGNCCQSNKFDENESFAELAIRKPNAGVIGYIGGSQYTYWDEDYYWGVGVGNIVEQPDYNNTTAGCYDTYFHTEANEANDPSKWYITNYQIAQAGNLAVEASTSTRKPYYWVIYQLAGDPSVIPYIGLPQPMAVNTSPSGLIIGAGSLTVNAAPYAYVALSQNGVLVAAGSTDASGSVNLQFDPSLLSVGNADLVVTAQNKVPYINTVVVAPANTPYVSLDNYTTSADANFNSTIQLNVNLKNVAAAGSGYDAVNVHTTLSTTDQYITINDNNEDYGNIPAGGNKLKNSVYDITIADNVPDQHVAHFNIEITGEDTSGTNYTWNSTFTMTINAPAISIGNLTITNDANANGLIDPGETGDLNFTISNTGHADANFNGELFLTNNPNSYYTLGATTVSPVNIPAGSSHDFVFTGASVDASAPLGTEIELSLTVNAGDNNQYTLQSVQNTTTGLIPIYNISTQGTLSVCTGTFYDSGLDTGNYSDDEDYTMTFLVPAGQDFVVVDFTSFDIEDGYDYLYVYDGADVNAPQVAGSPFTGTNSPGTLMGANGLTFKFVSDASVNKSGWIADVSCFTATTAPDCVSNPSPADNASNVFPTEISWDASMGATSYDVYFGTDTNPLNNTPVNVTTTTMTINANPNTTYYWTVQPKNDIGTTTGCNVFSFTTGAAQYFMSNTTVTTCNGVFYDEGGPNNDYSNSSDLTMTFMPETAGNMINVYFNSFDVELGSSGTQYDYLEVYDGTDANATLIGKFSANGTVPPELQPVVATNSDGALTFKFHSDNTVARSGWDAVVSCGTSAVNSYAESLNIYPNPTSGLFTINTGSMKNSILNIYSISGKLIYQKQIDKNKTNIDLRNQAKGLYIVKVVTDNKLYISKLIVK